MRCLILIPCLMLAALLGACTEQPVGPAPAEVISPAFNAVEFADPPWAKNWGDPIIGPDVLQGPLEFVPPCAGEDMDYEIWWAVWAKVVETPSGNVLTNQKVWYYPTVTKLVGVDSGDEWLLDKMTQSWNLFVHHRDEGVEVWHANVNSHYENPETGERIKGTEVVEFTWYPDGPPDVRFKRYDFRCIGTN